MSEENTPAAPPAAPPSAAEIAKQAAAMVASEIKASTEAVTKAAEARIANAARVLTGQPEVPLKDQILETLLTDPVRALRTVADTAKKEALDEVYAQNQETQTIQRVVTPFLNNYPGLKTEANSAAVEQLAARNVRAGMSKADALTAACEKVIKDNGLKSAEEAHRESAANRGALPGMGGGYQGGGNPTRDEGKSVMSFIDGMKAKSDSFKSKK